MVDLNRDVLAIDELGRIRGATVLGLGDKDCDRGAGRQQRRPWDAVFPDDVVEDWSGVC